MKKVVQVDVVICVQVVLVHVLIIVRVYVLNFAYLGAVIFVVMLVV